VALKAIVTADEHAKLPEPVQGQYAKADDGRLRLIVERVEGWALEDVADLKSALSKERSAAKMAAERLQAFGDVEPAKAKEALEKVERMSKWTPEEKVAEQIKAREAQLAEKWGKEVEASRKEREDLQRQLEAHLVTASAVGALTKQKGNVELLLPHVQRQIKVERDGNGTFVARVVDKDGHLRITPRPGSQDPMSIEELVESMRASDIFAPAFAGSGASGSGAQGSPRAGNPPSRFTITREDARDPSKYRAAKEAAQKAGGRLEIAG